MYTVLPFLEPERKCNNVIIGKHYLCYCPYCGEKNTTWVSEYDKKETDGTNKCKHFTGLSKQGNLIFKSRPSLKIVNGKVNIDEKNNIKNKIML